MIRSLCITMILTSFAFAQDFETFLQNAIAKSSYLKASDLNIERSTYEGALLQRYENPNVELEASSFRPDADNKESGYRVALTQPVRLWGVSEDKRDYADTLKSSAMAESTLKKAQFIRKISLMYLVYVQNHKFMRLALEEQELAKKIYAISTERYRAGTISKGKLLQAKIDFEMVQNRYERFQIKAYRNYMSLLKAAQSDQETVIDTDHTFKLLAAQKRMNSPDQRLLQAQSNQSMARSKVNENAIEWINLYGEYEKEPDQNIARIGVNLPLALFNTKSQERQIARLEAKHTELIQNATTTQQTIELKLLSKESAHLKRLYQRSASMLKTELELLEMYEEGYKIANINLLELQDIKNRVIATKKRQIDIEMQLQSNIINQNYLQGSYNE